MRISDWSSDVCSSDLRHHMREVQGRDRRLADIGINVPRQAAEPGLDGVDALDHAGEVAALDHLFDEPQALIGDARVIVPDGHGCGDIGRRSEEHTSELQSLMRISYAVFCLKKKNN